MRRMFMLIYWDGLWKKITFTVQINRYYNEMLMNHHHQRKQTGSYVISICTRKESGQMLKR